MFKKENLHQYKRKIFTPLKQDVMEALFDQGTDPDEVISKLNTLLENKGTLKTIEPCFEAVAFSRNEQLSRKCLNLLFDHVDIADRETHLKVLNSLGILAWSGKSELFIDIVKKQNLLDKSVIDDKGFIEDPATIAIKNRNGACLMELFHLGYQPLENYHNEITFTLTDLAYYFNDGWIAAYLESLDITLSEYTDSIKIKWFTDIPETIYSEYKSVHMLEVISVFNDAEVKNESFEDLKNALSNIDNLIPEPFHEEFLTDYFFSSSQFFNETFFQNFSGWSELTESLMKNDSLPKILQSLKGVISRLDENKTLEPNPDFKNHTLMTGFFIAYLKYSPDAKEEQAINRLYQTLSDIVGNQFHRAFWNTQFIKPEEVKQDEHLKYLKALYNRLKEESAKTLRISTTEKELTPPLEPLEFSDEN